MRMTIRAAALAATIGSTLAAAPALAGNPQGVIDHAVGTLTDLRHDAAFGNARALMQQARAILIAPRIFKAGFFVGGEGGTAVLMVRGRHGFSDPAFYTVASGSFGLQIGATESEMILFVMNERALNALLRDKFQIGADAGVAVATLGSEVAAGTTAHGGADIITWASSSGAYVGISLNGTVFQPDHGLNRQYYGPRVTTGSIVFGRVPPAPHAAGLVEAMDRLE